MCKRHGTLEGRRPRAGAPERVQTAKPTDARLAGDGPRQPRKVSAMKKVGRNDPCPCGSGKKYKNCHGKATENEA